MKKRNYVKGIVTGISMLMIISSVGCSGNVESSNETTTEKGAMIEAITETTTEARTEETTEKITEEIKEEETEIVEITTELENADYMTTEGFVPTSEVLEDCEFSCEKDEEHVVYKGEYALDGKDKYEIIFTENYFHGGNDDLPRICIEINGIKKELRWAEHVLNVGIVDVDITDEYKEVAIFDDGPSGDPSITLVRFDGEEIYELACFEYEEYAPLLFDKNGSVISSLGYIDFLETKIVSEYHILSDNTFITVHVAYDKALDKTYTVSSEVVFAFGESDDTNIENGNDYVGTSDDIMHLNKGDKIKLINFNLNEGLFYVQLPDGRIGYMLTCLAG